MFGEKLLQLRKDAGLTQVQLVHRSGVPQGTISNWENPKRGAPQAIAQFFRLCDALGVTCEYFHSHIATGQATEPGEAPDQQQAESSKRKKRRRGT